MGKNKKRKREKSTQELMRKIQKIQKEVEQSLRRRRRSSSDTSSDEKCDLEDMEVTKSTSELTEGEIASAASEDENNDDRQQLKSVVIGTHDKNEVPGAEDIDQTLDISENITEEILSIIGEAKKSGEKFGKKIPSEISERWGKILLEGLAKDTKATLLDKLLVPENFQLTKAPRLNAEVAAVLTTQAKNRDKRLEKTQNQLGSAIAGVANLTSEIISNDIDKIQLIQRLSEVNQVLLDLHYQETLNRRQLIIPMLDKSFINIIQGVKRDTYLFGDKLVDNINSNKTLEKSSQQIKKAPVQPSTSRRTGNQPGNARAPPRQQTSAGRPPAPPPAPTRYYRTPALPAPTQTARRQSASAAQRGRAPQQSRSYDRRGRR